MKDTSPIIVNQSFTKSKEELWKSISVHSEMIQWFFENIPEFKAEVGFETQFPVQSEDRVFTHQWIIKEVIPYEKITYSWKYKEYEGEALVHFELSDLTEGTMLTLRNEGLHNFPDNIPEFTRESCTEGWKYFIQGRLKEFLN